MTLCRELPTRCSASTLPPSEPQISAISYLAENFVSKGNPAGRPTIVVKPTVADMPSTAPDNMVARYLKGVVYINASAIRSPEHLKEASMNYFRPQIEDNQTADTNKKRTNFLPGKGLYFSTMPTIETLQPATPKLSTALSDCYAL